MYVTRYHDVPQHGEGPERDSLAWMNNRQSAPRDTVCHASILFPPLAAIEGERAD